jgi:hypothetical protein
MLLALGWRFLRKNELGKPGPAEHERTADFIVAALEKSLRATEEDLRNSDTVRAAARTPDSIALIFGASGVEALPHGRLLYHPVATSGLQSSDADALMRDAGELGKRGAHEAALERYARAMRMAWTSTGGVPTELAARAGRCELLAALGRTRDVRLEGLELRQLLLDGRWRITRPIFQSQLERATRWSRAGEPPAADRLALSEAVDRLYARRAGLRSSRSTLAIGATQFTVLVQSQGTRTTALIAGPMYAEYVWKSQVSAIADQKGVRIELIGAGAEGEIRGASQRNAESTGLPWTVVVRNSVSARKAG